MKGQLMCELKFATFSCQKRRGHQADKRDSEYSLLLQNALEPAILLVRLLIFCRKITYIRHRTNLGKSLTFVTETVWYILLQIFII